MKIFQLRDALNTDTVQGSAGATNYRRNNVLHSQFVKGQTPSFQDNTDKHWTIWKDFFDVLIVVSSKKKKKI